MLTLSLFLPLGVCRYSKLELSEAQMELIKKSTAGLEGLAGYHIDVEQELQFEKKIGEGAFGIV